MRRHTIYGDTDSSYCSLKLLVETKFGDSINRKDVIKLADSIGKEINDSFPEFAKKNFLASESNSRAVEAVRDVVAVRGLFKNEKKRYALHVIDQEGKPCDEVKIVGMETRRSDTPKMIQEFLEQVLEKIVKQNLPYEEVQKFVDDYRTNVFRKRDPWLQGSPVRVSKLTVNTKKQESYQELINKGLIGVKKPAEIFAVTAAINTNRLMDQNGETRWDRIRDGDKVEVIYLKPNQFEMKTVAMKVGENYVPDWFKELPFDLERMEEKLFDKKLFNTVSSVLGWDFAPKANYAEEVFEDEDFFADMRS